MSEKTANRKMVTTTQVNASSFPSSQSTVNDAVRCSRHWNEVCVKRESLYILFDHSFISHSRFTSHGLVVWRNAKIFTLHATQRTGQCIRKRRK